MEQEQEIEKFKEDDVYFSDDDLLPHEISLILLKREEETESEDDLNLGVIHNSCDNLNGESSDLCSVESCDVHSKI